MEQPIILFIHFSNLFIHYTILIIQNGTLIEIIQNTIFIQKHHNVAKWARHIKKT